ncbi:HAD family phosphatase [Candidatus Peregrinibacteria bacterium]|nr:HAD family phosphatase [Candidatus Peregrinibacteria bacterium]
MKDTSEKIKDCLILFDLDGVITDSLQPSINLFYGTFEEDLGLKHDPKFGRENWSLSREQVILLEWGDLIKTGRVSQGQIRAALDHYRQKKLQLDLPLLPHVADLFFMVSDEFDHIAVVSSNTTAIIEQILLKAGLRRFVQKITGIEAVSIPKPDPAMYRVTAEYFGIPPSRCLVFEDSVIGITAAQGAGMHAVGVLTGSDTEDQVSVKKPDRIVHDLGEVTMKMIKEVLGI